MKHYMERCFLSQLNKVLVFHDVIRPLGVTHICLHTQCYFEAFPNPLPLEIFLKLLFFSPLNFIIFWYHIINLLNTKVAIKQKPTN